MLDLIAFAVVGLLAFAAGVCLGRDSLARQVRDQQRELRHAAEYLVDAGQEAARLRQERDDARACNHSMADRIAQQSQLLARQAERRPSA